MNSPFKIFRKHQKGVMVVMVFAALILFGIGDTLIKMVGGSGGPQGTKVVVETNVGKLTQMQMHNLLQKRKIAYRFIQIAYARSHPEYENAAFFGQLVNMQLQRFGFGQVSESGVVSSWLYRHEARKLGIVVSDKQVDNYFDGFTDGKLSDKQFHSILREMQIGAKELFDIFRDELQAVTAYRMKVPVVTPSPERYWEYYQQLNTREKIEVAALPVKDFTGQVPDPTDAQIAKLFEKHKNDIEQAFEAEFKPGFLQPRRVKLQYLELGFAEIEAEARAAAPATEKEIEDYYEANKDLDRRFHEAETGLNDDASPLDPGFAPDNGDKMPQDEADSEDKPKPAAPDEESGKPPVDEPKSDEPKPKLKDSPSDEKPEGAAAENKPDCTPGADDDAKKEAEEKPDPTDKPAAKPPTDAASEKGVAGEKKGEDSETKDESATDDKESKENAADAAVKGPSLGKPHEPPKMKYKPLDDKLKEMIRESIIQDRAKKAMKDQVAKAREAMSKVAAGFAVSSEVKLTEPNPKELDELERRADDELNKIAKQFGMKFGQTPLVSKPELSEIPGLGKAQEPGSFDPRRGDSTSIAEQAFDGDALCRVFESETLDSDTYLCWKVRDVAEHVPDLKEPGVREQVVTAWKRIEALPLSEKRAKELVKHPGISEKGLAEALAGQTVTGDAKGTALTVAESKEFSFWREPTVPNFSGRNSEQPVQLDDPGVVKNPGRKFMQVVFDQLGEGDVGLALNNDATEYYIVKVISRRPADREAFKDVSLFVGNSPYAFLARLDQQFVLMENGERFREKYAIKWHTPPGRDQGQMMSDDE